VGFDEFVEEQEIAVAAGALGQSDQAWQRARDGDNAERCRGAGAPVGLAFVA